MDRLTSDNAFEMSMTELALNQVFVRDGWAWYRKGPEEECSVCDLIRSAAYRGLWQDQIDLAPDLTDADLGDVMLDWLQFGEEEPEGILAILYRALWAMAEVRERLKKYEDTGLEPEDIEGILERGTPLEGGTAELMKKYLSIGTADHFQKLAEAEKDGRLVVRHGKWIKPSTMAWEHYCSVCKGPKPYFYGYGAIDSGFCPSCGAKMDK